MPKYTNSRHTQGIQFVEIDGVSYRKTGNFKSISSVTHVPDEDVKLLYVDSCSAADFGQQELTNGSTVDIPETQQEFQIKFDGVAGDTANVVLKNAAGDCNIEVSVNVAGQLVWDSGTGGVAYTFTTIGEVLNYTDCNGNTYDVVYAGTGSWFITVKLTSRSSSGGGSTGGPATYNILPSWNADEWVIEGDMGGSGNPTLTLSAGDTLNIELYNGDQGSIDSFVIYHGELYNGDYLTDGMSDQFATYTDSTTTNQIPDGSGGYIPQEVRTITFTSLTATTWAYTSRYSNIGGDIAFVQP